MTPLVIYTDLDGSLLDHHTYSFAAAEPLLGELAASSIPVVPCTSKTRAELSVFRHRLGNAYPFIIENGSAVYWEAADGSRTAADSERIDTLYRHRFVPAREHWRPILEQLGRDLDGCFTPFSAMQVADVVELTGLSAEEAAAAMQREFGEAVHWRGSDEQLQAFSKALREHGAAVHRGGRFIHVMGPSDKGRALQWLNDHYNDPGGSAPISIAIGDGNNDVPMLEVADYALLIRSPVNPLPAVDRDSGLFVSQEPGPAGWQQGLRDIFAHINFSLGGIVDG
ncbi:HAD-superfamily hydrolase YedP [Luminiphilus syltensis NOR5-1B]|uniref:HAD-superfamily hydrolase YedP n=1 Tax=Luminiphilus syltensis NOR5-1B TaxID=565045 RepID=B8KTK7_9GAMM|nr:HAD-IIB family hydrolase [Luminiphilus syltensis]EED34132.1 HAD-superfamily hydrolase YedP [Luminiphilus syltensis NOR5-1B]